MTLKTLLHPYFMILLNTYILTNKQGQSNKMEAAQYLCPRLTNLKQKLTNGGAFGIYYTGLEANQPLRWFKMEAAQYLWPLFMN